MKPLLDHWIDEVVIGLNLCPWAKPVHEAKQLYRVLSPAATPADVAAVLAEYAHLLEKKTGTVVIGFDRWVIPFPLLWSICEMWEEALPKSLQLVVFHPNFMFGGEKSDSLAHWVNRSPFPVLQLIRSEDIAMATAQDPARAEALSARNEKKLNSLSAKERKRYFPWLVD